jgi:hypothetical protein
MARGREVINRIFTSKARPTRDHRFKWAGWKEEFFVGVTAPEASQVSRYVENAAVDRYLSAKEAAMPTISLPTFSFLTARSVVACSTAPEDMPTGNTSVWFNRLYPPCRD